MIIKAACLTCDWGITPVSLSALIEEISQHAEECSNLDIIVKIVKQEEEENETSNS